ncbi:extracellular solute-binding protein [Gordonibacter sp.]|uniref:extracellular solute-binding protein n=1 Tax=Gordonibacter sp. TaxID=1968902 RepID=UPI002FC9FA20
MRAGRIIGTCVLFALTAVFACVGCTTAGDQKSPATEAKSVLDPSDPVQVELWTYYNGTQQQAFEDLVKKFNAGRGKDVGVVVTSASQGGVNDLASAVTEAAQELVGSAPMPDAFLAYSDTASVIDGFGRVADLSGYLTDDEKGKYVESFLAEGDINGNGGLKVFPVGKSTETLQANLTDWQKFADKTGSKLDGLATIEGITAIAQRYYEWTDAQTPDVPGDGRPFFGRDAMANYLITGSKQLGHELLVIKEGACTFDLDRTTMKALWDNYYVPMVQGWFSAEGKFRSDAVKTGDLICYLGSSSSVVYFPKTVTIDDQTSYPIELAALASPTFEGGVPCAPQQGAGFVVTKSNEKKEAACVEFLKWFTDKEQSTSFSISAGYVPVTKEALTLENLESAVHSMEGASENYLVNLPATLETIENGVYATPPFEGGVQVRSVLGRSLSDKAVADRAAVVAAIEAGATPADAVAPYLEEAVFDVWLSDLAAELKTAAA